MATAKRKVINANIILYGPPAAGKTSNIQFIHRKLKPSQRGQISTLAQEGYPQVSYEFLPIELGELKGYDTNLYIYTSPDNDDGLETRLNLLNEAAGVVFIADSTPERMDDNIESLTNLKEELRYWGIDYDSFPLVFQYNKRDLPTALSRDELDAQLNVEGKEVFEAVAAIGQGVRDTFALISKMAVRRVRLKLTNEDGEETDASERAARAPLRERPVKDDPVVPSPLASEVTLEVAPPPRYEEEEEADTADGAAVQTDERLPEQAPPPVVEPPPAPVEVAAEEVADVATPAASDEGGSVIPIERARKGRRKGKRKDDERDERTDGPEEARDQALEAAAEPSQPEPEPDPVAPEPPSPEVEEASSRVADDDEEVVSPPPDLMNGNEEWLKISVPSSLDESSGFDAIEAGEAEEAEAFEDEDEEGESQNVFSSFSGLSSESLGKISLPDGPLPSSISFADLGDDEVNIRTYEEEDEEEEDEKPMIRLGARASEEELQLEEEMLEDDLSPEPEAEGEPEESPVEEPGAVETPVSEPQDEPEERIAAEDPVEPVAGDGISDLPPQSVDELGPEGEEQSIIASQEELAEVGLSNTADASPVEALAPFVAVEESPAAEIVDDDDELSDGPDTLPPTAAEPMVETEPSGTEPSASAEVPTPEPAVDEEPFASTEVVIDVPEQPVEPPVAEEDQALPDLAISPLDEDAVIDGPDAAPVSEDPVFDAIVAEPSPGDAHPAEPLSEGPASLVDQVEELAARGPVLEEDEDEQVFDEEREAAAHRAAEAPVVTGWGSVTRLDSRTLLMPVTVKVPGADKEVQLAVTIKVDLLLDGLLGGSGAV